MVCAKVNFSSAGFRFSREEGQGHFFPGDSEGRLVGSEVKGSGACGEEKGVGNECRPAVGVRVREAVLHSANTL